MSINHHLLAKTTTDSILAKFKSGDWKCYGNVGTDFYRTGVDSSFPSPDAAFYDDGNKIMVSFEFKPPTENKRGILTGLGQSIAYLKSSNISYLIIPKKLQGFDLQYYMKDLFSNLVGDNLPIGLIAYDNDHPSEVSLIHNVDSLSEVKQFNPIGEGRFWAKHVDLPIPLFHLILHCYYLKKTDQVKEDAFAYCWKTYLFNSGSLKTLEPNDVKDVRGEVIKTVAGTKNIRYLEKKLKNAKALAKKKQKEAILQLEKDVKTDFIGDNYYNSIKKNLVTFLKHVGMVDSTGTLTDYGVKLYHLGLMNGPNSKIFQDYFLKCVLITGHHLDLIFDINGLCNEYRGKKTTEEIKEKMNDDYEKEGMIKRNPNRKAGKTSKVKFLKYEFLLWRSLSLIEKSKGKPNISFNWKKITEACSLPEL